MASRISSAPLHEAPKESAVARLLIAPITFVSFLLSLALIDYRNVSLRHHIHAPSRPPASDTLYGRIKVTLHSWIYRPQPYAYVRSPDVLQRQKSGGNVNVPSKEQQPWHWNTRQRTMMKMEVADAFEMRRCVLLAMAVVVAVFAALAGWFVRWSFSMIKNYM